MGHLFTKNGLLIIAGAVLHTLALTFGLFYLSWVCLVPLFIATQHYKGKNAFVVGAFYGIVFGCLALFWLPITVFSLIQGTIWKAILTGILALSACIVFYSLIIGSFSFLKRTNKNVYRIALLIASIWTVSDFLLSSISDGMPWFSMCIGNTLLDNLYAIQPAEFGGVQLLVFILVFINYLFSHYFIEKQWRKMIVPFGLIIVYMIVGYFIFYNFQQRWVPSGKQVKIALLNGNIAKTEEWSEETGNTLVRNLLNLNKEALLTKPDIVLWTESIVPWSYKPDDDFIKAILKNTLPATYQIIGMNTEVTQNVLYNSAYCFLPDGTIVGRYDKHHLVSMAEQTMHLFSPSIQKKGEESYYKVGEGQRTITTLKGKIGVLICNEVFVPKAASAAVAEGAEFLVSLASDALVTSAVSVINQQFFRSRLRAVEVRKDIAVSCNMGISGMIAASGEVMYSERSNSGLVSAVLLQPNNLRPQYQYLKMIILLVSIVSIIFFLLFNFLKPTKT